MVNNKVNSNTKSIFSGLTFLLFFSSGCTSTVSPSPATAIISTQYCNSGIDSFDSNPENLYQDMLECINANNYQQAVLFYAKAGTLTWYYSLEEDSESNRIRHKTLLSDALGSLNKNQKEKLTHALGNNLNILRKRDLLCARIVLPQTSTVTTPGGFRQDYWDKAKKGYLHCQSIERG
ncbi:hypothetical protein GA565_09745 [Rouxiella sp. S1S-2]|uniref:hypothetical protein n=1 Tax=Rouxiella sp. S1S-2 TaxID=2653856 RepID=UPI001264D53C|nr:hypothetical protein [Rouxiella sp. S1S-2]KAB7896245.1 hypothetical protein GA565_09745 [Rouxiella sp. S1S-2]